MKHNGSSIKVEMSECKCSCLSKHLPLDGYTAVSLLVFTFNGVVCFNKLKFPIRASDSKRKRY